ncbi:MAG TPA: hypothetical protein DDX14_03610 [Cyanobacteria bacterium UBA9579]|nr:hypothetical protein [Cyanobacteria bacterium UBA9579]
MTLPSSLHLYFFIIKNFYNIVYRHIGIKPLKNKNCLYFIPELIILKQEPVWLKNIKIKI